METKKTTPLFPNELRSHSAGGGREKIKWREKQRDLPISEKVALLGQTILETLELEKIKRHAKGL
ncbi:MAG: hypothetical protein WCG66_10170 [bacterium]